MDYRVNRRSIVVAAVSILGLTACGGTDDNASDAARVEAAPEVAAPNPLTGAAITDEADLQSRLLTTDDLPAGFTVVADPVRDLGLDPATQYDAEDMSGTDPQRCADVLAEITRQSPGAAVGAAVRYSGPDFSSIDQDAASYLGDGAADAFSAVQQTLRSCSEYSGTDADGIAVEYSVSAREQETIGDASTSVRLETTSEGYTLVSDAVVTVVDHTVVQLVATSQEGVDPSSLTELARTAASRIRGVGAGL